MLSSPAQRGFGVLGGVFLVLAAVHCGAGRSQASSSPVGPSGGDVASGDGALHVSVPAGAVPKSVTVTVAATSSPAPGALGTVYEIGPTGTRFATPVKMTFSYAGIDLAGHAPSDLRVATYAGGAWQPLTGYVLDTGAKTVTGTTTHLSPYALWVAPSGAPACTGVAAGADCSGSSSSGGPGTTTCGPAPTCASASAATDCAPYPGAALQGCTNSPTGYSASCCFAPGAPICMAVGGGVACSGGSSSGPTGGSGSSGGSSGCGPTPTCASAAATACDGFPGATLKGCTDSSAGFSGACCFAPSAPVCVKTSVGFGCGGGSGSGSTSGGSPSGGGCGPAPTCASSSPCAAYPGAAVQSCTDNASGFDATCCFPPGTLPSGGGGPVLGGSGSGGSTGSGSSSSGSDGG